MCGENLGQEVINGRDIHRCTNSHKTGHSDSPGIGIVFLRESLPAEADIDFDDIVKEWRKHLANMPSKRSNFGQAVTATAGDGSSTFKR